MADFNQIIKDNALSNLVLGISSVLITAFIWPKKWYLLGSIGQPIAFAAGGIMAAVGAYGMFLNSQANYTRANYANTINPYYRG